MITLVLAAALLAVAAVTGLVIARAEHWTGDAVTEELDIARNVRELRAMSDTPLRASDEHYRALAWRDHAAMTRRGPIRRVKSGPTRFSQPPAGWRRERMDRPAAANP